MQHETGQYGQQRHRQSSGQNDRFQTPDLGVHLFAAPLQQQDFGVPHLEELFPDATGEFVGLGGRPGRRKWPRRKFSMV